MNLQRFLVAFSLFVFATTLFAQPSEACARIQEEKGYPSYYCDCKEGYTDFVLPIDTMVKGEAIWYKGWVSDLYDGLSAYLHSDCDLNFEVYTSCTAKTPKYQALFEQNKANAIDGESIKRKLEENQVGNIDMAFYIRISPIAGEGGRLIMRKESDGMPSTCDDPLYMLPGMSLYSTQPNDVYIVDPTELYELTDIILQWEPDVVSSCQLQVTSGTCDGPLVAQTTLQTDDIYIIPAAQIRQALNNNQILYLHFSHDANKPGMVHCLAPEYEENYIDTLLCQGMGLAVYDTLLTEATVYTIDTTHQYDNVYLINYYDLSFYEPDLQYDTLAFKYTQSPYLYRGQYTINKPGNYDLTIHNPGQCDEHYQLYVYHDIDTVLQTVDTFLCYGAAFEYKGKIYKTDISIKESSWKNQDSLMVDVLNLYFATTPDIIYDTINVGERKYGRYFNTEGDFSFTYTNATTRCVDSIILHVQSNLGGVNYTYDYIDVERCQGLVYDHYGDLYTSSVVIRDSIWFSESECLIEVTTITFIPPTPYYDTISIKSTALPYNYHGQKINEFGTHDITIHVEEECDERYILTLVHDIDTIYQSIDTTLCQGTPFLHDGVEYTQPVTLVDTQWRDDDTYVITTINVAFIAPTYTYESIRACHSYQWQGDTYTTSGQYTYHTTTLCGCDSIVTLDLTILPEPVIEHDTIVLCTSELPYLWYGQSLAQTGAFVHSETYPEGCDSVLYNLYLDTYNQTLPEELTQPVVAQGRPVDTSIPTEEIMTFIAADQWYAPHALVTWLIYNNQTWETLTDSPLDNNVSEVKIKYMVQSDCGIVESEEMIYYFTTTGLDNGSAGASHVRKIFQQNQIYILRDGHVYTTLGTRVK